MNNTINEIKNSLQGINSRINEAEEWISDLEDKIVEITPQSSIKNKVVVTSGEREGGRGSIGVGD